MPVARSRHVHLSKFDLSVTAEFVQSPDPLNTCGDEETSLAQRPFTDLSQASVTGIRQGISQRYHPAYEDLILLTEQYHAGQPDIKHVHRTAMHLVIQHACR